MTARDTLEAPFFDVTHALRSAYGAEASEGNAHTSQVFNDLSGRSVRLKGVVLDRWERLAQSSYTISLTNKALKTAEQAVLDAKYTYPVGELEYRKEQACEKLSRPLWEQLNKKASRQYLCDVTREWGGMRRNHSEDWWAQKLNVSDRTLRNYRCGNKSRHQVGAVTVLDAWHDGIISKLEDVFVDAALIQ